MSDGEFSLTKGTAFDQVDDEATDNQTTIWTVLDNISDQTINWLYTEGERMDNTYPDNFTSNDGTIWHAGDNITR